MLLEAANEALGNGQLVAPDDSNARNLFREALVIDPGNGEALQGLRAISNDFVLGAQVALNADDPSAAYTALATATETDPTNPSIVIVSQLLAAKGNSELADARLAVATGDFELATQRLARAEQYQNIDAVELQSIRNQIEASVENDGLAEGLAAADAFMKAGQLVSPEAANAHTLLLEMYADHGDDARLLTSMERLGERLLTRAAFAAAADRAVDATELIDAVDALGVLAPEVEAARLSVGALQPAPEIEELQAPQIARLPVGDDAGAMQAPPVADTAGGGVESTLPAAQATDDVAVDAPDVEPQTDRGAGETLMAAAATQAVPDEPAPQAPATPPEARRLSLQELGIKNYVAPKFPRRATLLKASGLVAVGFTVTPDGRTDSIEILYSEPGDVFADSATNAVRRWKFETRDKAVEAQVTLRFEYEP